MSVQSGNIYETVKTQHAEIHHSINDKSMPISMPIPIPEDCHVKNVFNLHAIFKKCGMRFNNDSGIVIDGDDVGTLFSFKNYTNFRKEISYLLIRCNISDNISQDLYNNLVLCKSIGFCKDERDREEKLKLKWFSTYKSYDINTMQYVDLMNVPIENCQIEEYYCGTTMTLFHDGDEWIVSTRFNIGANQYVVQSNNEHTYRDLFFELCDEHELSFDYLPKEFCFTFILNHKEVRIVSPVKRNRLILVGAFICDPFNLTVTEIDIHKSITYFEDIFRGSSDESRIEFTKILSFDDTISKMKKVYGKNKVLFGNVISHIRNIYANKAYTDYSCRGYVVHAKLKLKDGSVRCIRFTDENPSYQTIKNELCQGTPYYKLQNLINNICTNNLQEKYLKYFPEDMKYIDKINSCVEALKNYYYDVIVHRKLTFEDLTDCQIKQVKCLQKYYLKYLLKKNMKINHENILKYFANLKPNQQCNVIYNFENESELDMITE